MDSPYPIVAIAILVGIFVLIATTFQIWACIRSYRRIQREKLRLREIRIAATQGPPPYAVVMHERNMLQPQPYQCQCRQTNTSYNINNTQSVFISPPSADFSQTCNLSRPSTEPLTSVPLRNANPCCTQCRSCSQVATHVGFYSCNIPEDSKIEKTGGGSGLPPPTYEEATKYLSKEVTILQRY